MNKGYKILFWVFPLLIIINIVAGWVTEITGVWLDLPAAILTIYAGGPLWVIFFIFSIVLFVKKKADSLDRKFFITFLFLSSSVVGYYLYDVFSVSAPPSLIEQNPELQNLINTRKNN